MQKPKQKKLDVVVLKKAQPPAADRNFGCTCGKVYRNPLYTVEYATCPVHSSKTANA